MKEQEFTTELLEQFNKSTDELLATIVAFSDQDFNTEPPNGGWTAGQVAEHLLKAEYGLPRLFQGNALPPGRPANEKVNFIKSIFLDFTSKFQSPEFILPTEKPKNKEELVLAFQNSRNTINKLINEIDMSNSFPDFPLPGLDVLTGWEWICFVTCHTIRHTRQMKRIFEAVNKTHEHRSI